MRIYENPFNLSTAFWWLYDSRGKSHYFTMTETKPGRRRAPKFELIAGNLALDFINTLDDRPREKPKELLKNFYELARFGEDTGILTGAELDYFYENAHLDPDEAGDAVRRAIHLREAMYAVFSALMKRQSVPQKALGTLNTYIRDAVQHSQLVQNGGRCELRYNDMTSRYSAMLWPIARAAADLLTSSDLALLRACSSVTCQWLFLDTSKNRHRRWCSMKLCGNRAKVRKFYSKTKTETKAEAKTA
jgi:predicted RNA-binding Zn ribbon-like protein